MLRALLGALGDLPSEVVQLVHAFQDPWQRCMRCRRARPFVACPTCRGRLCAECLQPEACALCAAPVCRLCAEPCRDCDRVTCERCRVACRSCGLGLCLDGCARSCWKCHGYHCAVCTDVPDGWPFCDFCSVYCEGCGGLYERGRHPPCHGCGECIGPCCRRVCLLCGQSTCTECHDQHQCQRCAACASYRLHADGRVCCLCESPPPPAAPQ